jgi:choline dehydrogenase
MEEQEIVKLRSPFSGAAPYDLHIYPWVEEDCRLAYGWRCIIPISILRPKSRGWIKLRSPDPHVLSEIDTGYLRDRDDAAAMQYGIGWAEALARSQPFSHLIGQAISEPLRGTDAIDWARANHRHYWHPAGSCRMGPVTDPLSVVDHTCKVHGVIGISVADASVFPDVPRGTTALPTTVVGERAAQFISNGRSA